MVQQWSDQDGFRHVPKDETEVKLPKEVVVNVGTQWTWPSTVAFVAVLGFLAFVIWMIFG